MNQIEEGNQQPTQPSLEKATSENGGSTNLSENSLEQVDEEFKQPQGQKFEFINENYEQWPKWSLGEK